MVMSSKHRTSLFVTEQDQPQCSSENGPDSPFSGDDSRTTVTVTTTTTGLSTKKSRRSIQKRVVSVPIGDHGSRSKGEAYPPSDSWAWRKYGQKPIKGSPYPRGYYRCSSSKGCPARKQVERSHVDPTMLVITYACEHNHPIPTSKHHHHHHNHHQAMVTNIVPSTPSATTSDDLVDYVSGRDPPSSPFQMNPFCEPPPLEFIGDSVVMRDLGIEYSWISDVSFYTPSFMGPICYDIEVVTFKMKEEDESLFGDLDELPECSAVFRPSQGSIERCTACGST